MTSAAAFGMGCVIPTGLTSRAEAAFRMGDVPTNITLSDLKGRSFTIPSDFRGKVVLLHFWASWCPTCRGEMKALEAFYARYGGKGIIPCSIGLGEKRETALAYLKNMTMTFPVLLDPGSASRKPFAVAGIPTYYLLDRQGALRHRILGEANKEGLERMIRSLL